jgi:hypothetical protein
MRLLKHTATNTKMAVRLEDVPEEFLFVQSIALRYADNSEQLKTFYAKGVEAARQLSMQISGRTYESKVVWVVEQNNQKV